MHTNFIFLENLHEILELPPDATKNFKKNIHEHLRVDKI